MILVNKGRNNNKWQIILLSLVIAISTKFYCYINYQGNNVMIPALLLIFIILFLAKNKNFNKAWYKNEVIALLVLPFVSAIPCLIYRGQAITTTLVATRTEALWLFYFILHQYKVPRNVIVKSLLIAGFIAVGINVLQEFSYPSFYLFDDLKAESNVEVRNGLYRFRLFVNNYYVFFCFFYFVCAYLACRAKKYIPLIVLFAIGVYFTLTRQIWVSIYITVFLFPFYSGSKLNTKKIVYLLISIIALYIISNNLGAIFGEELLQKTTDAFNNEDEIRKQSMLFYGLQYWEDPINVFLGNGRPSIGNSDYGTATAYFQDTLGFWRSDIGIIGTFSYYGVVYILAVIMLYKKILKNFKKVSSYSKMLVVASLINLPLAAWLLPIFFSFILYLQDLEIEEYNYRKSFKK